MQQSGGTNKVLRIEPLGEPLIDRCKQLEGLSPAPKADQMLSEIGSDAQFVCQGANRSRFGKRFSQQPFTFWNIALMEYERRIYPQQLCPAPALALTLLMADRPRDRLARLREPALP